MIRLPFDVPVTPDQPEARRLLEEELARPEYQQTQASWWDRLVGDILDWFLGLDPGRAEGTPATGLLVLLLIVVGLLVISFLIFGLPRVNRRSKVVGTLFGEDDARTASQMRASAEAAAARRDFATAIAEMFRSIARGLAERTVLTTTPGTTARHFAAQAGKAFPEHTGDLYTSALAFDDVRYLGRPGTAEQFAAVARLERALRAAKPLLLEVVDV